MIYNKPDLHMHSDYSDGDDVPELLLENVRKAGLDVFSLTDHDSVDGCKVIRSNLKEGDPKFINGIEFSVEDGIGHHHVLGYGYSFEKPGVNGAAKIAHERRVQKATERFCFLEEKFGFVFPPEDIELTMNAHNPGKPHFAKLMEKNGFVKSHYDAYAYLNQFHSEIPKFTTEEAMSAILNSDGVPVLAHAFFGDGEQLLTEEEVENKVVLLKNEFGLMGVECFYSAFNDEHVKFMLHLADKYHLLVSCGSDYHGKGKHHTWIGNTHNPDVKRVSKLISVIDFLSDD